MTLSARAVGIYTYMLSEGRVIPARQLMDVLDEGRNAIQVAINELRDANIIRTKRTRLSNGFVSYSGFVEPKDWDPKIGTLSVLLKLYSQYINIANMLLETKSYANPETPDGVQEKVVEKVLIGGSSLSFEYMSADDKDYLREQQEERQRAKVRHDAEKNEQRAAVLQEKLKIRDRKRVDPKLWTVSDSAYEFANLLHNRWDVAPWTVSESRFIQTLGAARSKHSTNGLIEQKMTQMFLSEPIVQTMKDANSIWKLYISRFGSLAERARYVVTDVDKAQRVEEESRAQANYWLGDSADV